MFIYFLLNEKYIYIFSLTCKSKLYWPKKNKNVIKKYTDGNQPRNTKQRNVNMDILNFPFWKVISIFEEWERLGPT